MKTYTVNIDVDATYSIEIEAESFEEAYEKAGNRGFVRNEDLNRLEIAEARVATIVDDNDHTEEYY